MDEIIQKPHEKDVQIGRLKKRIEKLKNQRDHFKENYLYFKRMIEMYPHIRSSYRSYEERKAETMSYKSLESRVKEQAELIKRLLEETSAKSSNIQ